jgi:hypothetical protein
MLIKKAPESETLVEEEKNRSLWAPIVVWGLKDAVGSM